MSCLRGDNRLFGRPVCGVYTRLEVIETILAHGVCRAELVFTMSDRKGNFSMDIF